jgi:hypothetical protein
VRCFRPDLGRRSTVIKPSRSAYLIACLTIDRQTPALADSSLTLRRPHLWADLIRGHTQHGDFAHSKFEPYSAAVVRAACSRWRLMEARRSGDRFESAGSSSARMVAVDNRWCRSPPAAAGSVREPLGRRLGLPALGRRKPGERPSSWFRPALWIAVVVGRRTSLPALLRGPFKDGESASGDYPSLTQGSWGFERSRSKGFRPAAFCSHCKAITAN